MNIVLTMNERKLIKKILNELPIEIIYKIYLYCPHKREIVYKLILLKPIKFIIIIILLLISSYFMGLLITRNTSYRYISLNIFVGYMTLVSIGALFMISFLILCRDLQLSNTE